MHVLGIVFFSSAWFFLLSFSFALGFFHRFLKTECHFPQDIISDPETESTVLYPIAIWDDGKHGHIRSDNAP